MQRIAQAASKLARRGFHSSAVRAADYEHAPNMVSSCGCKRQQVLGGMCAHPQDARLPPPTRPALAPMAPTALDRRVDCACAAVQPAGHEEPQAEGARRATLEGISSGGGWASGPEGQHAHMQF